MCDLHDIENNNPLCTKTLLLLPAVNVRDCMLFHRNIIIVVCNRQLTVRYNWSPDDQVQLIKWRSGTIELLVGLLNQDGNYRWRKDPSQGGCKRYNIKLELKAEIGNQMSTLENTLVCKGKWLGKLLNKDKHT